MIEEGIVVSDTNIFLDLLSVDLIEQFFSLPCKIHTTDFVINEITRPEDAKIIQTLDKLNVVTLEFEELSEIGNMKNGCNTNASITDCSVWYYAKKTSSRLLTGDNKLRRVAEKDSVKVAGILFVFDNLVDYKIISKTEAANALEQLIKINCRLPKGECERRIDKWRQ